MRPSVQIQLPDASERRLPAGGILGRLATAAVRVDDPRISEAHLLLSLRGRQLKLLALRGPMKIGTRLVTEATATAGMRVHLAPDYAMQITAVELPSEILGLTGLGALPAELSADVASIRVAPPELVAGYIPDAPAHVVSDAEGWRLCLPGEPPRRLRAGDRFSVEGLALQAVLVPVDSTGQADTRRASGMALPLRLVARYETVHIEREGKPTVVLRGLSARIVTELVRFEAPTPWVWIAREIWKEEAKDRDLLRKRWDRNLTTLRRQLRERGVRGDLVRPDGHGNVELVLREGDTVVDES